MNKAKTSGVKEQLKGVADFAVGKLEVAPEIWTVG
jgi:hypothetical protein